MASPAQSTIHNASVARPSFPFPNDTQAWWNFVVSGVVGWLLVFGLKLELSALALAIAGASLFFCSDWLSHLAGRSREGEVRPISLSSPLGWGLLSLTAISLGVFLRRVGGLDREAWATVITAVGCLVAFMFVLRMELRPLDGRLLFLTHFIVTLPCLMYGFVQWGVGAPEALGAWYLPAAYFPAQALFAQYWMEGPDAPGSSLSRLAAPLLVGVLLLATRGQWPAVAFLTLFSLRAVWGLQVRRRTEGLPGFGAIRRFSWELQLWNLAGVLAWALSLR